ncbi:MAG TPA: ion channel [Pseudolabrys sp.]|jgi:hypothetical protein|nr:ion channel [Pseudolabrys sp.]
MIGFHVLRRLGYIQPPANRQTARAIHFMAFQVIVGTLVSLLTFCIHGLFTVAIVMVTRRVARRTHDSSLMTRLFALFSFTMAVLTVAHLIEVGAWTAYYALADIQVKDITLFEFAFENYTALGYGDVVAPAEWRLTGPITSLNGLLLIGWSVAIVFEVLRMAELQFGRRN